MNPSHSGGVLRAAGRRYLSLATRRRLVARYQRLTAWPPVGFVRFGSLRRLTPVSDNFGADRGTPIDRHYINDFLVRHAGTDGYAPGVIRGRVLEIGEARYSQLYGSSGDLDRVDILDVSENNPSATVVADLTNADQLPSDTYDCIICTQTLLLIYEVEAAIQTLARILKPGGTLLVTVPGICRICRPDMDLWGDYWRFTSLSARRLFEGAFDPADVTVEAYGNVMTASAYLYGLASEDLKMSELNARDPNFEVLIAVKALKR